MCINRVLGVRKKKSRIPPLPTNRMTPPLLMNSGGRPGYPSNLVKAEVKAMKHELWSFRQNIAQMAYLPEPPKAWLCEWHTQHPVSGLAPAQHCMGRWEGTIREGSGPGCFTDCQLEATNTPQRNRVQPCPAQATGWRKVQLWGPKAERNAPSRIWRFLE